MRDEADAEAASQLLEHIERIVQREFAEVRWCLDNGYLVEAEEQLDELSKVSRKSAPHAERLAELEQALEQQPDEDAKGAKALAKIQATCTKTGSTTGWCASSIGSPSATRGRAQASGPRTSPAWPTRSTRSSGRPRGRPDPFQRRVSRLWVAAPCALGAPFPETCRRGVRPMHRSLRFASSFLLPSLALSLSVSFALGQAVQEDKITGAGVTSGGNFGYSTSLDGDWAAISAEDDEDVYVFQRSGSNWFQDQSLSSPGPSGDEFGHSVSLSGSVLAVGAPRGTGVAVTTGLVYMYRYDGNTWQPDGTLMQADGDTNDGFGRSVSVHGDTLVVSAIGHRPGGVLLGAVYFYRYDPVGMTWDFDQKIIGPPFDPNVGLTHYGEPVALRNGVAVVGAVTANNNSAPGKAFIYRDLGGTWSEAAIVVGSGTTGDSRFGDGVATDGDVVVVGDPEEASNSGAVYVFRGPGWGQEDRLVAPIPDPASFFGRGQRISVSGGVIVVGNERSEDCVPSTFSGAAFVYRNIGTGWDYEGTLCSNDLAGSDFFGWSTSVDGDRALVGAIDENLRGAAYTFLLDELERIEGTVEMGDGRVPLAGVEIAALENDVVVETTMSDVDGTYEMGLPAGTYTIRAELSYQDPGTGVTYGVRNYPEWKPLRKWVHADSGGPTTIAPILYPDPVVMQGGLYGSTGTWTTLGAALHEDQRSNAFKLFNRIPGFLSFAVPNEGESTFGYNNSFPFTTVQHADNAQVLRNWVELDADGVLLDFVPATRINDVRYSVIGHSMGGLIARATTARGLLPRARVVVSLDGVQAGSSIAPPISGFGEANLNGTRVFMGAFRPGWNSAHHELDNRPPHLTYSAVRVPPFCALGGGVVTPDASPHGLGRIMDAFSPGLPTGETRRFLNGLQVAVDETHSSTHETEARLEEIMAYLTYATPPPGALYPLQGIPDLGCPGAAPVALGTVPGIWSGTLSVPGGSTDSLAFSFDVNDPIEAELLLEGPSASYEFQDAMGMPLAPTVLQSESIEGQAVFELLEFSLPPSEQVTLVVTAGPSDDARALLELSFPNGRKLVATADADLVTAGTPVLLTAQVEDALGTVLVGTSPSVVVTVTLPDGSTSALALLDDGASGDGSAGDGVFGGAFGTTTQEGRYGAAVLGTATLGAETVERTADVVFAVAATGALFSGSPAEELPDDDLDLLNDALRFRWPIDFTTDGEWVITAELRDQSDALIAELNETLTSPAGPSTQDVLLTVTAADLVRNGADGPWRLVDPTIVSVDADFLVADTATEHLTQAYLLSDFESPPNQEVAQVVPDVVPLRGAGSTIHLLGQNLDGVSEVRIGDTATTFEVLSDFSLRVTVPAPPPPASGPGGAKRFAPRLADITVTTPWHVLALPDALIYQVLAGEAGPR